MFPSPIILALPDASAVIPSTTLFRSSVTVLPATGLLFASFKVTVIVEMVEPFAVTDAGEAPTVDCAAVTAPEVGIAQAGSPVTSQSRVPAAVRNNEPDVRDVTVNVTT